MIKSFKDKEAERIFGGRFSPGLPENIQRVALQRRIGKIVSGKRAVTADTALRLARFFGTDAQSWVNLQAHYDLEMARERLEGRLEKEVTPMTRVA